MRAGLDELQVMGIGRLAAAQEARLLGHEPQVPLVAVALRRADREHPLVDPAGLIPWALPLVRRRSERRTECGRTRYPDPKTSPVHETGASPDSP
jgi:hypothetical protein